ncbi:MAG: porphobilinogen synthase [Candidatus Eremiobacterota bacterium]
MNFPKVRSRRLRATENIRRLVRETKISVDDFIYPLFLKHGKDIKEEISSMPGNYHFSTDRLEGEIEEIVNLNIPGIILFGIPPYKDEIGSSAYDPEGIIQEGVRKIKALAPDLLVITDVCLCEYTSHGHCGEVKNNVILNDPSLELIGKTALSHAQAGADMVAPSDMMDGRVDAIRTLLDKNGFPNIPVMSYAVKYASAFYGPFREAADSPPKFGDRSTYQMDPANSREAMKEVRLDISEGADIIMVKPALSYLDIISKVKDLVDVPVAAYNVSGEYSMIKAASAMGWIDEKKIALEILTSIKRAGADIIISYFAKHVAKWLEK